jgi:hypothetical protein
MRELFKYLRFLQETSVRKFNNSIVSITHLKSLLQSDKSESNRDIHDVENRLLLF